MNREAAGKAQLDILTVYAARNKSRCFVRGLNHHIPFGAAIYSRNLLEARRTGAL
jgi:hypothetical protein